MKSLGLYPYSVLFCFSALYKDDVLKKPANWAFAADLL